MGNNALIWTFASVIVAACFARGVAMRDSTLEMFLWYTLGAFVLAGASIIWISLEPTIMTQHRVVLGFIGAIFGALALLSLGEWTHPTSAQPQGPTAPSGLPPVAPPSITQNNQSGPNIVVPGQGNILNIYPSQSPPQPDPDALYQLKKPVGQVESVVESLSTGTITFGLIRGAMNLNAAEDFQYRNYILHINSLGFEGGQREGPQGRWIERRLAQVICRIVGNAAP
jgi:hypothetical protein